MEANGTPTFEYELVPVGRNAVTLKARLNELGAKGYMYCGQSYTQAIMMRTTSKFVFTVQPPAEEQQPAAEEQPDGALPTLPMPDVEVRGAAEVRRNGEIITE